jgi:hypothetical protein
VVLRRDGRREVLVELAGRGEEEEPVDVAEDGELLCLLEQSVPALVEGGLPLRGVLDPLYLAAPLPVTETLREQGNWLRPLV